MELNSNVSDVCMEYGVLSVMDTHIQLRLENVIILLIVRVLMCSPPILMKRHPSNSENTEKVVMLFLLLFFMVIDFVITLPFHFTFYSSSQRVDFFLRCFSHSLSRISRFFHFVLRLSRFHLKCRWHAIFIPSTPKPMAAPLVSVDNVELFPKSSHCYRVAILFIECWLH